MNSKIDQVNEKKLDSELEEENQELHTHQAIIEQKRCKVVQIRERRVITTEHRLALFKQQQSQIAKVLKRTLVKLKETQNSLDNAKANLDVAIVDKNELSEELLEARQEASELREFYHSVIKIVAESHEEQHLKDKLLHIITSRTMV